MSDIWSDRFIKREMLPVGKLAERFNIANPRMHPEAQRAATESSLDTVGWIDEISLSTNGDGPPSLDDNPDAVMFDGHERVEIALVRGGPDMLVPVRWYQLSAEETDFALLVKDQSAAMAQIIPEKMAALMERAKAMTSAPGLQGMMERLKEQVADGLLAQNGNGAGKDTEPQIDKSAELQEKWQVHPGQLWQLGEHRVICGDCTDAAVVELVMGGERAALFNTDPPYGISYGEKGTQNWKGEQDRLKIASDTFKDEELQNFLESVFRLWADIALNKNAAWYLWHAHLTQGFFAAAAAAAAANVILHRQIIWVKPSLILGMGQYHWKHEPCFFGWIEGHQPPDYNERTDVTVWEIGRQNETSHPTEKPVELFERPIKKHTKFGEICAEPFLGSGSQLIACHNLNRRCRGIEIEPKYVAVTLQRFLDHTGIQPRLLETVGA